MVSEVNMFLNSSVNLDGISLLSFSISAHVIQDGVSFRVLFLSTVIVDCECSVSEVAVLVVLKHKIADGVPRLFSVYELNRPEGISSSGDEFVESMNFFSNPETKTFIP